MNYVRSRDEHKQLLRFYVAGAYLRFEVTKRSFIVQKTLENFSTTTIAKEFVAAFYSIKPRVRT